MMNAEAILDACVLINALTLVDHTNAAVILGSSLPAMAKAVKVGP